MTSRVPGLDRIKAINGLRNCILDLGETDERDGLVIDNPDLDEVGVYIFNQCVLTATALKRVKHNDWKKVARASKRWLINYQNLIQQWPIRNAFEPIVSKAVVPVDPSFVANVDVYLFTGGAGTATDPSFVLTNTCPVDPLTADITDLSANRALLRCLYRIKSQGDDGVEQARDEYDQILDEYYDGFGIFDGSDIQDDGEVRYATFKHAIQWLVADELGEKRIQPKIVETVQKSNGRIGNFFFNDGDDEPEVHGTSANTETTSLVVIADTMLREFD